MGASADDRLILAFSVSRRDLEKHFPRETNALVEAAKLLGIIEQARRCFPAAAIGDPSWQILLDLLVQGEAGRTVSVSSACIASGAPPTTALRYVSKLVAAGYVVRTCDPNDGRRVFLSLSPSAKIALASLVGSGDL